MPAIEIGKRFIEDNDPRPHGQNTRQRYQKLLTGGELLRMSRKQMLDAEPTGDFVDTLPDFCRCIPQTFQAKGNLTGNCTVEELPLRMLKDQTDPGAYIGG